MKCFYHSADLDGQCSGAIVKYAFPDCEMIGINYGDKFPWDNIEKDEVVWMVDFSLQPFQDMIKLSELCELTWIDHHKSAIAEYEKAGLNKSIVYIREGIGACKLVWELIYDIYEVPPLAVKLLAEYDVWNHNDVRTLPFQYGLRFEKDTYPDNQSLWKGLSTNRDLVEDIINTGHTILQYEDSQNEKFIKSHYFISNLDGLKCICANKGFTNSKLFDSVWDEEKYHAMLTFIWRKGQWTVSLYSTRKDVDVSEIAKARGGGGHKGAAGFQCSELPFILK